MDSTFSEVNKNPIERRLSTTSTPINKQIEKKKESKNTEHPHILQYCFLSLTYPEFFFRNPLLFFLVMVSADYESDKK